MRGKYDYTHFLEEYVDVCLILGYIKEILKISDEDIFAGCAVKYNRLKDKLNKEGIYS